MLDQEQIEAPQFSEIPQKTLRPDCAEGPVPQTSLAMSPLTFGAAMMRMATLGRRTG